MLNTAFNVSIINKLKYKNIVSISCTSSRYNNTINNVLDFNSNNAWTSGDIENQSFTINFKNFAVIPYNYSMKTVSGDHYPLEWNVEGSYDGEEWITLSNIKDNICKDFIKLRYDDVFVCSKNIIKTYTMNATLPVSYIKVQQIGTNSGALYNPNYYNYLNAFYLAGIEFYGDIYSSIFIIRTKKISITFNVSLFIYEFIF